MKNIGISLCSDEGRKLNQSIAPSFPFIKTSDGYDWQDEEWERSSSVQHNPKKLKLQQKKEFGQFLSIKDVKIKGSVSKN